MGESAVVIRLENVTKTYGRGHTAIEALHGISFEVPSGSFWSVMGPSGSGKSTLMHILGLLDRPSAGTYQIGDNQISADSNLSQLAQLRRQLIGFVFQQFFLLPRLSACENVMLPGLYAGSSRGDSTARAEKLLGRVGLSDRANHRPNELSGGEQQRVAIARALMNDPSIILADEPTGNLDSRNGQEILALLDELHQDGKTILLVTHDAEVGKRAQKTIHLKDGRLA